MRGTLFWPVLRIHNAKLIAFPAILAQNMHDVEQENKRRKVKYERENLAGPTVSDRSRVRDYLTGRVFAKPGQRPLGPATYTGSTGENANTTQSPIWRRST